MSATLGMPPLLAPVPSPRPSLLVCDDDALYEVVNGKRVEKRSMGVYSSDISFWIAVLIDSFVRPRKLGKVQHETLFILDPVKDIRRRPDVAFVSAERWPLDRPIPEKGDWEVVPDLAIEVISPTDLFMMVTGKVNEYFRYGVRQVWLVVPGDRQIHVFDSPAGSRIRSVGEEMEVGELLPGFRLVLADIFQQPPVVQG